MSTFESDDCRRFGKRRLSNPLRHCVRASLHHIRQVRDGQCAIAPKRSAPSAERQLVSLKSYRRNQEGIHLHFPQRHRCTHFLNVSRITARSFVASTTPGSRASKAKAIGRDLKRTPHPDKEDPVHPKLRIRSGPYSHIFGRGDRTDTAFHLISGGFII